MIAPTKLTCLLLSLSVTMQAATNVISVCDENELRAAVEAGGVVAFGCDGLITLSSSINIATDVLVDGRGYNVSISGDDRVRVFSIASGVAATFINLTITAGKSTNGAGILNLGELTLIDCELSSNLAIGRSGLTESAGLHGSGGALYNAGTVVVSNCWLSANNSVGGTGGAGFFAGNGGYGFGGAVFNSGTATIISSTLSNNLASGGIGGSGDTTDEFGDGGSGGNGGNAAGGAIYSTGTIHVIGSTFLDCRAVAGSGGTGGPGVYAGPGGHGGSGAGAGVNVGGGYGAFTNCTFYHNTAAGGAGGTGGVAFAGGGFGGEGGDGRLGFGGGIYTSAGTSFVVHATLSSNRAEPGLRGLGGVGTAGPGSSGANGVNGVALGGSIGRLGGTLHVERTIVAASAPVGNISGSIIDGGFNISSDSSYRFIAPGSVTNTDPRLGPLADNGGDTPTMALLNESPALDAIPASACIETDQRGVARPHGTNCDIGAFEGEIAFVTATMQFRPAIINPGEPAVLEITVSNPNPARITGVALTNSLPDELTFVSDANTSACGGILVVSSNVLAFSEGNLDPAQACTISVGVTSLRPGVYTNQISRVQTFQAGAGPVFASAILEVNGTPQVSTLQAESVTATSAFLHASVNPRGASTAVWFEYGLTTNYGSRTALQPLGAGRSALAVSNVVTGLVSGASYHYRAVASNTVGVVHGEDQVVMLLSTALFAVRLDGTDDFVSSPNLGASFSNETMTVELWFRPFTAGVIIDERGQPPPGGGWQISLLEILDTGEVRARVNGVPVVSLGIATFGHWHHVALRYDSSLQRLSGMLDGAASTAATGDRAAPWEGGGSSFFLAFGLADNVNMGAGRHLSAELDEIRIWSTARTDREILGNQYARLDGREFGLVAYWRCDEGTGVFANDAANQYSALLYNGVRWVPSTVPLQATLGPLASTLPAVGVTTNAATLLANVAPREMDTTVFFEFGRTINYGNVTPLRIVPGGLPEAQISETLVNLLRGAQYHYRIIASNSLGLSVGENRSFTVPTPALYAAQFDGINDFIGTPNLNSHFPAETVTVEMWFNASAAGVLIDERGQTPPAGGWQISWLEIVATGEVRARVNNVGWISLGVASFDRWQHVAMRYNKATLTLDGFLNGIKSTNAATGDRAAPGESGAAFFLAFGLADNINMGSGAQFRGLMDEIRIWNVARTDQQIAMNYARRLVLPATGLVAYWPFDTQESTEALDVTGNGNHGTLSGRPLIVRSSLPAGLPQIQDVAISNINTTSAVVHGAIYPNSLPASFFVEWGDTLDYGRTTPLQSISTNLGLAHSFSIPVTGLVSARPYYTRVVSSNENGINLGADLLFHTAGEASGPAVQLDGVAAYIMSPDLQRFFPSETVTIELWFNPAAPGVIIDERGQNPPSANWQTTLAELLPSGDVMARVHQLPALNLGKARLGQWHHIALRYNKATLRFDGFLNGVQSSSVSTGDRAAPWESSQGQFFAFGLADPVNMGSGVHFKGQIDEIRVWNVARTSADIGGYMNYRLVGNEEGLVAYWRCDDGSGATLQDSSGRGNTAALVSGPTWAVSGAPLNVLYASTSEATGVEDTTATLVGTAVPNGNPGSAYFEWGTTLELSNRTATIILAALPPTQTVTQRLDTLQPATLYYFRFVVEPSGGTRREGVIKSFETAGNASGGAVSLDGLNDYIYSPNLRSLVSNETFTVEVWFRPLSQGVIIDERGQAPPGASYQLTLLEVLGTGEIRARVNGIGAVSLGTVQFGRWHYAALRYDKPALSLVGFLNGTNSLVAAGDRSAPWESGHQWYLGFGLGDSINLGSGAYFRGELDEIRIWSLARTDQELAISRYRSLKGDENGLLAYWKLDDPAGGNTVVDASGHGNHGTLVNGASRVQSTAPVMTLVPIAKRIDGSVVVQFSGVPMHTYIVEHSSDLVNWETMQPIQATRTGVIQVEQPVMMERAFFRLVAGQ